MFSKNVVKTIKHETYYHPRWAQMNVEVEQFYDFQNLYILVFLPIFAGYGTSWVAGSKLIRYAGVVFSDKYVDNLYTHREQQPRPYILKNNKQQSCNLVIQRMQRKIKHRWELELEC